MDTLLPTLGKGRMVLPRFYERAPLRCQAPQEHMTCATRNQRPMMVIPVLTQRS